MTKNGDAREAKPEPVDGGDFRPLTAAAVAASAMALAACGGGGGGSDKPSATVANVGDGGTVPSTQPATPLAPGPSALGPSLLPEENAARFLAQAGLSATPAAIQALAGTVDNTLLDYKVWLDAQFAIPAPTKGLWQTAMNMGFDTAGRIDSDLGMDNLLWARLFTAQDELRQRVVLALSEIFVVSVRNMPVPWGPFLCLSYWDVLEKNCFGTFRDLIEAITLSPAMGVYLSMRGSQQAGGKSGTDTGRRPDENYARELMQLFTIGLLHLDDAAQPTVRNGQRETFTNDDVTQLAAALTGWDFNGTATYTPPVTTAYTNKPMVADEAAHDKAAKTVLGQTIKAGQSALADLRRALDILCAHPNVAPFIAKQLIQRLVSSNPEPDHIRRVVAVFNDNGKGVRGDMQAVIRAVLTDPWARAPLTGVQAIQRCKLREPLLRFIQWGRLVGLNTTVTPESIAASQSTATPLSALDWWNIGDLSGANRLAQSPLRSPSVFNFFRPGYVPLNSGVSADGFVAPEFQITDESSVIGYANFMLQHIDGAAAQHIAVDYSPWQTLAANAVQLVDKLNLLLTGRAMSQVTVGVIAGAINSLPSASSADLLKRVKMAFYLMLVSADYMVQR